MHPLSTMRPPSTMRLAAFAVAGLAAAALLAGCGSSKSTTAGASTTPTTSGSSAATGSGCIAQPGSALVTLADDKHLQLSDDIIPVVLTSVAKAPLTTALNNVSADLSQAVLNNLNVETDVDHTPSTTAASGFISQFKPGAGLSGGSGTIKVVAANFSENQTLADIYADVLNQVGYHASVAQSTNREVYLPALEKGTYDVVPEYAATLTEFLNDAANGANAPVKATSIISQTVAALTPFATAKGLTPLTPAAATDENAFAVTKNFATKYGLTTLSQFAATCNGGTITLGGPAECPTRAFCEEGLKTTYGIKFTGFTALDAGGPLDKNALVQGKVTLALVFSSDAGVTPAS